MAVMTEHILTGAVTADSIADGTVVAAEIKDGEISEAKLATGAVTETKLGSSAVTAGKIGTGAVTEDKLGSGAVTVGKIGALAVDATKVAAQAVGSLPQPDELYTRTIIATNCNDLMQASDAGVVNFLAELSILTTQRMWLVPIYLRKGQVVTNIAFTSVGAADTPLNWWFALYSGAKALLGQTADQTNTAWGVTTKKSVALAVAYTVIADGFYYVGIMMKANTPVTLKGLTLVATSVHVGQTADTALTTTAPGPAGAITASASVPMVEIT
jgi:hypothetical protein